VLTSVGNGNQTLNLVPLVTLRPNTQYTLNVAGVADLSGRSVMQPISFVFTTGPSVDFAAPQVVAVSPSNGATGVPVQSAVQVQFSKAVNALTVTNSTFTVSNGASLVAGSISVAPDGRSATFTPSEPLSPATTYVVRINSGAIDLGGQAVTAFQSSFTTN
jgi:hypothetical protein